MLFTCSVGYYTPGGIEKLPKLGALSSSSTIESSSAKDLSQSIFLSCYGVPGSRKKLHLYQFC